MGVITIGFPDFKRLCKNRRIYFYEGETFVDLHFLSDGFIVKTTVSKEDIVDAERFFSDKIFYGMMRLDFNIPVPKENKLFEVDERKETSPATELRLIQDEEVRNVDIQVEGVKE